MDRSSLFNRPLNTPVDVAPLTHDRVLQDPAVAVPFFDLDIARDKAYVIQLELVAQDACDVKIYPNLDDASSVMLFSMAAGAVTLRKLDVAYIAGKLVIRTDVIEASCLSANITRLTITGNFAEGSKFRLFRLTGTENREYNLAWRGDHADNVQYYRNDVVGYAGAAYVCNSPAIGEFSLVSWDLLVDKGATDFLELTDTPDAYTDQGGKAVKVKMDGTGLEFGDVSAVTDFLGLTDTPDAYGTAGQTVVVNATGNGLEFGTPSGAAIDELTDVADIPTPIPGYMLARKADDSGYVWSEPNNQVKEVELTFTAPAYQAIQVVMNQDGISGVADSWGLTLNGTTYTVKAIPDFGDTFDNTDTLNAAKWNNYNANWGAVAFNDNRLKLYHTGTSSAIRIQLRSNTVFHGDFEFIVKCELSPSTYTSGFHFVVGVCSVANPNDNALIDFVASSNILAGIADPYINNSYWNYPGNEGTTVARGTNTVYYAKLRWSGGTLTKSVSFDGVNYTTLTNAVMCGTTNGVQLVLQYCSDPGTYSPTHPIYVHDVKYTALGTGYGVNAGVPNKTIAEMATELKAKIPATFTVATVNPYTFTVTAQDFAAFTYSGTAVSPDTINISLLQAAYTIQPSDSWAVTVNGQTFTKTGTGVTAITQVVDYFVAELSMLQNLGITKSAFNKIHIIAEIVGYAYTVQLASVPIGMISQTTLSTLQQLRHISDIPEPVPGKYLMRTNDGTSYSWALPTTHVKRTTIDVNGVTKHKVSATLTLDGTMQNTDFWRITVAGKSYAGFATPSVSDTFTGTTLDSTLWGTYSNGASYWANYSYAIGLSNNKLRVMALTANPQNYSYGYAHSKFVLYGGFELVVDVSWDGAHSTAFVPAVLLYNQAAATDNIGITVSLASTPSIRLVYDYMYSLEYADSRTRGLPIADSINLSGALTVRLKYNFDGAYLTVSYSTDLGQTWTAMTPVLVTSYMSAASGLGLMFLTRWDSSGNFPSDGAVYFDNFTYAPINGGYVTCSGLTLKSLSDVTDQLRAQLAVDYDVTSLSSTSFSIEKRTYGTFIPAYMASASDAVLFDTLQQGYDIGETDHWTITVNGTAYTILGDAVSDIDDVTNFFTQSIASIDGLAATKISSTQVAIESTLPGFDYAILASSMPAAMISLASSSDVLQQSLIDIIDMPVPTAGGALKRNITNTGYEWIKTKHTASIGDGVAVLYTVVHSMNTMDISVSVRQNNSPYAIVYPGVEIIDANSIRVKFATPPVSNEYKVIILG